MDPKDFVSKTEQPIPPRELAMLSLRVMEAMRGLGGPGSGNFGHSGRPGQEGGSGEGGGDAKKQVDALESLRSEIQRNGPRRLGYGKMEIEEIQNQYGNPQFAVRDFGDWKNPPEAEDDEDYDWQVPTEKTVEKLNTIVEKFSKQFGVQVGWSAEEKNWITFYAESAKKGRSAGGPGSGNFGHAGRPGEVGGSGPGGDDPQLSRPSSDYPPARPDGLDTQERFKVGREYTPERKMLHRAIIVKTLAGKSPVKNPTAVVLGGGPASGKSTLEKAEHLSEGNVVLVNPDTIKAMLPEYEEGKARGDKGVSSIVHEESSDISKQLTEEAAKGSYNIVLDGTGDSSVEKLGGKIAVMRSGGHEVVGKYVTLPVDLAWKLAQERAEKPGPNFGRLVPESYLRESHAAVSSTFAEALKQGLFDRADLYDTTELGNMRKVVSAVGKNITIHDQALWNTFLAKGRSPAVKAAGGKGSGNFGHAGRPGQVGGSGEGEGRTTRDVEEQGTPVAQEAMWSQGVKAAGGEFNGDTKYDRSIRKHINTEDRALVDHLMQGFLSNLSEADLDGLNNWDEEKVQQATEERVGQKLSELLTSNNYDLDDVFEHGLSIQDLIPELKIDISDEDLAKAYAKGKDLDWNQPSVRDQIRREIQEQKKGGKK